jgi:anti-sigma factor RsiW
MTGCNRFGAELEAYLDGELSAPLRDALDTHLPGCADCRSALDAQRWLAGQIRALLPQEPSPQFEARFWARIAREDDAPGFRRRLERWLPQVRADWALGAAALAVLALLLSQGEPALPPDDWAIVADAEQFALLESGDLELLAALDLLEEPPGEI